MEFVTSIPLLLAVLVFTAEYGEALRERMVLDNATHDVARFLARSPIDNISIDPTVVQPVFYAETLQEAQRMFNDRVGYDEDDRVRYSDGNAVAFDTSMAPTDQNNFRNTFIRIQLRARTFVDLPLLSLINAFSEDPGDGDNIISDGETGVGGNVPLRLFLTAETQVRWLGGAEPGSADCTLANRYAGICP